MIVRKKDTSKLLEELTACADFNEFYKDNGDYMVDKTLSEMLKYYFEKKQLRKSEVIRNSELSEIYGYQIFSGARIPERKKLLCLILSRGLNVEETQKILKSAGYSPLYTRIPFDCAILYAVNNGYTVLETNALLYKNGLELLG